MDWAAFASAAALAGVDLTKPVLNPHGHVTSPPRPNPAHTNGQGGQSSGDSATTNGSLVTVQVTLPQPMGAWSH